MSESKGTYFIQYPFSTMSERRMPQIMSKCYSFR
mgnify:CR=1 FL=1